MKKLLLIAGIALLSRLLPAQYCGSSGPNVCTPSGTVTTPGLSPFSNNLPSLINGEISSTVVQFKNLDTLVFGGQALIVQSLQFDTIENLPAGLCWASNKTNNTFANQEDGCIVFNGTTCATPGQYRLRMILNINVGVSLHLNANSFGLNYYLRVKNAVDTDTPLDTAGEGANTNTFISYGNTADCNPVFSVDLGADQTVCNGSNITLNPIVHSGHQPYTYNWSSSGSALSCTTCNHPEVTVSQTGAYTVTVIDATNTSITGSITYTVSAGNNQVQFASNNTDIDCSHLQDTTLVTVTGGVSPYTFEWGDGTSSISGISPQTHVYHQAGTFVIAVTDGNSCVTSSVNTINFNGILINTLQTVQPVCAAQNTGKITVGASGGTSPYTFAWSNNGAADSIVNIPPGGYTVTVTDAASCSFTKHFTLSPLDNWGYYVYLQTTGSNCNNNGFVNTTVNAGISPFTFSWNNGSTTQNLVSLTAGTYSVTVSDSLGCLAMGVSTVPSVCYSLITGTVFNDINGNCIFDTGEIFSQSVYITATGNGQTYYGSADANGSYEILVPGSGTFAIGAMNSNTYSCGILSLCGNANQTVTIVQPGDTSTGNNFGFTGSPGFDLNIHPGWVAANPGFTKDYWILCGNNAPTSFNGPAIVSFTYDPNLIYQTSSPVAMHNLATHTLTWSVTGVTAMSGFSAQDLRSTFLVPQTLSLGQPLSSYFHMEPTIGDCDSSNNTLVVSEVVTGSHDPNEKKVEPAGRITEEDSVLTYTIGFQNTGTDSTHFIIIKDTLSTNLDPLSVRNVASSHPYSEFSISGKGILTWTFNPLRLVDSFTNEPGSHGFVKFTVKKKANMPIGSTIRNTAHIYFDYNEPVVTNTVADTISEPNSIFEIRSTDGISVSAYPNPFSNATNIVVNGLKEKFDFELFDVTGRMERKITSIENNQFQLTRDNLPTGVYFFKILSSDKKKTGYGKLVVE